jgi:hypothetical protein
MSPAKLVGTSGVRLATIALLAASAAGVFLYRRDPSTFVLTAAIVATVLAFLGLVHSFGRLYSLWMRFADVLHVVSLSLLFGACYLLVVPLFYLIVRALNPLGLRRRGDRQSFWIRRRSPKVDPHSFQRMG